MLEFDRRSFIASLGGAAAVALMTSEEKAEALEEHMEKTLDKAVADKKFPKAADIEAQVPTRPYRRGGGNIFVSTHGNVSMLEPMPEKPTLIDFFRLRFKQYGAYNHVLQSANRAQQTGQPEHIVFACLLHDTVQTLVKADHAWWGAQMYEPYVSEKVAFAIRYHGALRYFADPAVGYEYPDLYRRTFGEDYVPPKYIQDTYKMVRNHKWYMEPRLVTVNDLYAFDPNTTVEFERFIDIIGRNFKQPKEGLGYDNSPVAHFWRTMQRADQPL
jgi:hypothetical protein